MPKRPLIHLIIFGFIISLPISLVLAADKSSSSNLSPADQNFVKEAAVGGMMEVELGKIAADKATNDKVKAFGRQMQEDHGKAAEELHSRPAKPYRFQRHWQANRRKQSIVSLSFPVPSSTVNISAR